MACVVRSHHRIAEEFGLAGRERIDIDAADAGCAGDAEDEAVVPMKLPLASTEIWVAEISVTVKLHCVPAMKGPPANAAVVLTAPSPALNRRHVRANLRTVSFLGGQ
jgi:hypothetical protein